MCTQPSLKKQTSTIIFATPTPSFLSWIRATGRVFKTFVQNRLTEIRKLSLPSKWYFCSTETNPADLITRFYTGNLSECKLWREGPDTLKHVQKYDNKVEYVPNEMSLNGESKDNVNCTQLTTDQFIKFNEELMGEVIKSDKALNHAGDNAVLNDVMLLNAGYIQMGPLTMDHLSGKIYAI